MLGCRAVQSPGRWRGVAARGVALVRVEGGCLGCFLVLAVVVVQRIVVPMLWCSCWCEV